MRSDTDVPDPHCTNYNPLQQFKKMKSWTKY